MELMDFLHHRTEAGELCAIRCDGWIVAVAYIDCEDLFSIPSRFQSMDVKGDAWGTLGIVDGNGGSASIPCHYVDI